MSRMPLEMAAPITIPLPDPRPRRMRDASSDSGSTGPGSSCSGSGTNSPVLGTSYFGRSSPGGGPTAKVRS